MPTDTRTTPVQVASPRRDRSTRALQTVAPLRLSQEIESLIAAFGERPVTLREIMSVLRGRAYTLLILLLALPFCTPIPLPGVSLPFGIVIAFVGFRLALNRKPWLPERLLDTALPPGFFSRLLRAARRLVRWLEAILRPRWRHLLETPFLQNAYGVMIMICGVFLMLPLPVPFSNGLPALTVVLLAGAKLERDGRCAIAGLVAFGLTLCFYGALAWGGVEGFGLLKEWTESLGMRTDE
jgi:hypothetical protein